MGGKLVGVNAGVAVLVGSTAGVEVGAAVLVGNTAGVEVGAGFWSEDRLLESTMGKYIV
jgi:hypothetical protein